MNRSLFFLAVWCAVTCGCAQHAPGPVFPAATRSTYAYTVAPLDTATLTAPGGQLKVIQVTQDGTIETPGGPVRVLGMSPTQFKSLLQRTYPETTKIELVEFRTGQVSILGEVFHQIHTEIGDGPMRLLDGIAAANGFTPLANKKRVKLVRQNAGVVQIYELDVEQMLQGSHLDQNMLLKPGDVITVPRNFL